MDSPHVGFAVIYRWRLHAGMEEQFQQAWERSQDQGPWDSAVSKEMQAAIAESFPPILMDPVCDHLVGMGNFPQ
jgi:hypothetical protein